MYTLSTGGPFPLFHSTIAVSTFGILFLEICIIWPKKMWLMVFRYPELYIGLAGPAGLFYMWRVGNHSLREGHRCQQSSWVLRVLA